MRRRRKLARNTLNRKTPQSRLKPFRSKKKRQPVRHPRLQSGRHKAGTRHAEASRKTAAAVVCGCTGPDAAVIAGQLSDLALREIIVVLENADAGSFAALRSVPGVTVAHVPDPLGPDGCRAVGARLASADTLLFVDGRHPGVDIEALKRLLAAVEGGADVALTDVAQRLGPFKGWDEVYRIRAFVNWSLGRPDLRASSVTAFPHAWSREGVAAVGADKLAVPARAHQAAIRNGLRFKLCPAKHPERSLSILQADHVQETGDFFEALSEAMAAQGSRLAFADRVRRRPKPGGESG